MSIKAKRHYQYFTEESIPILESQLLGHGSQESHCFTLSNPRIPKCSEHCTETRQIRSHVCVCSNFSNMCAYLVN